MNQPAVWMITTDTAEPQYFTDWETASAAFDALPFRESDRLEPLYAESALASQPSPARIDALVDALMTYSPRRFDSDPRADIKTIIEAWVEQSKPSGGAQGDALRQKFPCPRCDGRGNWGREYMENSCSGCNGTGRITVSQGATR